LVCGSEALKEEENLQVTKKKRKKENDKRRDLQSLETNSDTV